MDFTFATEPEIKAELGKRLADLRIAKGLLQSELAAKAAIGIATLHRIEQGEGATLSNFIRLLSALGRIDDLNSLLQPKTLTIEALEKQHQAHQRKRVSRKPSK
jgi:transcriptional regulator with XRE-family HTH domain